MKDKLLSYHTQVFFFSSFPFPCFFYAGKKLLLLSLPLFLYTRSCTLHASEIEAKKIPIQSPSYPLLTLQAHSLVFLLPLRSITIAALCFPPSSLPQRLLGQLLLEKVCRHVRPPLFPLQPLPPCH